MFKVILLNIVCFLSIQIITAQQTLTPENIKSIYFESEDQILNGIPLIKKGTPFSFNFDDINGDEAFYYYKISHYDYSWNPSDISKINYIDGFDNIRISETENSYNTLQIYTHYKINFPNSNTYSLKLSGNYKIEIYNEDDEFLFSRRFILYTNYSNVKVEVKRSRDVKYINEKQVVNFEISPNQQLFEPEENLKTLILKNNQLDEAILHTKPQYVIGNTFVYKYDQETSFMGGNEYLNFDSKDIRGANVSINQIELKDIYHHYLFTNRYRALLPYSYNPDINGNYIIRNIDAYEHDIEADYSWVHFNLNIQEMYDKSIYIVGSFNNYELTEINKMNFNRNTNSYQAKILLKQGFYNYNYITLSSDDKINPVEISGSFDNTENEYVVIFYYKGPNDLTDKIIGIGSANSRNITN